MKKISHLIIVSILAVLIITPSHSYAAMTYSYACSDGGTIDTTVDLMPPGPFAPNTRPTFTATGQITSSCSTKSVSLTAENKPDANSIIDFEPVATLIPSTSLDYGQKTPSFIPAQTKFTAPASIGTYDIHFLTGVDDNVPPQIKSSGLILETQNLNSGPGGTVYAPGYSFWLTGICLSDVVQQPEVVNIGWTGSDGARYTGSVTIQAGETCAPPASALFSPIIINGPSTGTAGPTTNICARAENPSIHVGPGVTECPPNQPAINFYASPASVHEGDSANLIWQSAYTDSCTSPDFDTAGAKQGSVSTGPVFPTFTQANGVMVANYNISCTGPGGTTSASTSVTICQIDPMTGICN